MRSQSGQICLVIGGSGGLGGAICSALAPNYGTMVVGYRSRRDSAEARVDALLADGRGAVARHIDVGDEASVTEVFQWLRTEYGRLDSMVYNAGVASNGWLMLARPDQIDRVLDINLRGAFRATQATMKLMSRHRSGNIVLVSSVAGRASGMGQAAYAASKAGVDALARAAATEGGTYGLRVNAVAPGLISDGMGKFVNQRERAGYAERTPVGRLGTADEVAAAVRFLLSDDASYITGTTLVVDGGFSMGAGTR